MIEAPETHQQRFEATYGDGSWERFCNMVEHTVRPYYIRQTFKNGATGAEMGKQPYYKWKARAELIIAARKATDQ